MQGYTPVEKNTKPVVVDPLGPPVGNLPEVPVIDHEKSTLAVGENLEGTITLAEALQIARESITEFIKKTAATDENWAVYYSTDWNDLLAEGILDDINEFGTGQDFEIEEKESIYLITDEVRGHHTEVALGKVDSKANTWCVEIG